ncbi:MAG: RagB/SusD family nutrient uptake outer membrane protein [Prevotella sp.]|nr:RagB/SusD family nutrient uptake outer membrane protein [Prevotella sp.]
MNIQLLKTKIKSSLLWLSAILAPLTWGGVGGGLASCSDFLEVKPLDQIVLGNFWNEESDVENVMAGCYLSMQSQEWIDRAIIWGEARSENLMGGERISDDTNLSNIALENINPNNGYCTWVPFYEVINRCNTILLYAPKVAESDPNYTQSELRATIAEASALRDLCYFYLIRAFRDVPYTFEPFIEDIQTMDLPATPFDQVLDSLTIDLERIIGDAVQFYPVTKPAYQTGRITQDAIHAMLCDMYLWKQDYQKAIEHADAVILSKQRTYNEESERVGGVSSGRIDRLINGYPLIADVYAGGNSFGRAFYSIFCEGNSSESIFELYYNTDDASFPNKGVSIRYGSNDGGNGSFCPSDVVANDISDGQFAIYNNRYDTRSWENIQRNGASQVVAKYASQDAIVNITTSPYSSSYGQRWPKDRCHANWIVYRLTDVMLMKAEALVLSADPTGSGTLSDDDNTRLRQAFMLVDAVNRRSYGQSQTASALTYSRYTTKTAMLNLVYDERNRELMFEGKRWFDLVRRSLREGNTNYLISQAGRKYTNNKSAAESKLQRLEAIFWPYNEEELKVNTNLVQNPAFGSSDHSIFEVTQ